MSSPELLIPQIEVLRRLRDNQYLLNEDERAALTDVINHFNACIDLIKESQDVQVP